jgi:hypothetical protein
MVLELSDEEQVVLFSCVANTKYPELNYDFTRSDSKICKILMDKLYKNSLKDLYPLYVHKEFSKNGVMSELSKYNIKTYEEYDEYFGG